MAANLKLNSTGGGSISFDPGSTASNLTFTFPAAGGQIATSEGSNTFSALTVTGNTYLATSSGSVGVGTASPAAKLDVNGAAIVRGTITPTDALKFGGNTSAPSSDAFIYRPADNTLGFGTGSTERLRIDSSGNVGIGVTPSSWSGLSGKSLQFGWGAIWSDYPSTIGLSANAYYQGGWKYYGAAGASVFQASGDGFYWNAAGTGSANASITFSSVLSINVSKTLALAGATPSFGTGISFPATQSASSDANTLDDYEEGTWTPYFTGSVTNPTVAYTVQSGTYTKVGNIVHVNANIQFSSWSGGSGFLFLRGLPFTSASSPSFQSGGMMSYAFGFPTNSLCYMDANQAILIFIKAGTAVTYVNANEGSGGGNVMVAATYLINT